MPTELKDIKASFDIPIQTKKVEMVLEKIRNNLIKQNEERAFICVTKFIQEIFSHIRLNVLNQCIAS